MRIDDRNTRGYLFFVKAPVVTQAGIAGPTYLELPTTASTPHPECALTILGRDFSQSPADNVDKSDILALPTSRD
jgi:hypothetical protein